MLSAVVRFCVREPLVVLLLTIAAAFGGVYAARTVPVDAIPNVGENQVIVLTEWPGRSPKDIEDQVTYPLSVSLLAVPGADSVRGKSLFGYSFVQVTFADGVDFYWARSRVSEQLGTAAGELPEGVVPQLGPDATGLGQVFYYVLDGPSGMALDELRSLQDFVVKYDLQAVDGVAEVASIGGYVRQYQIDVDPEKLRYQRLSLDKVIAAVKSANQDVGAKTVETSGMEFIVRGKGFLGSGGDEASEQQTLDDLRETVIVSRDGVPLRLSDVADVQVGPDFRRGGLDWNGSEAVGGVVVMRFGENPRAVIENVKAKIAQIEPALGGVKIRGIYDRTGLIDETIGTLSEALWQELAVTAAVILLFLLHVRSSLVVAGTLPVAVLLAFVAMRVFRVDANLMSLAGIAIAIGTMVDMAIVVSENIYRHLVDWQQGGRTTPRTQVIEDAATEVAPAVATAVSTTVVSFLPVFFLTGRDYKLFAPLAYTKTFAIIAALLVAVTVVPMLCRLMLFSRPRGRAAATTAGLLFGGLLAASAHFGWSDDAASVLDVPKTWVSIAAGLIGLAAGYALLRERMRPVEENLLSRVVVGIYDPSLRAVLRHKVLFSFVVTLVVGLGAGAWVGLPTVLKPVERFVGMLGVKPNELPGYVSFKHSFTGLKSDDWIALDEGSWFYMPTLYPAASFSQAMQVLQTQDVLIGEIPEVENVLGKIGRVDSALDPAPAAMIETYVMLKPRSEWREGVTAKDIWDEINAAATLPGVTPAAPLQPIEGRVVMLQSGIKAPMAVRIYGDSLDELAKTARSVADRLRENPYVNSGTVNPDIVLGKPYVEFTIDREASARYGMSVKMVGDIIATGLGGMNLDRTVEGRERYPIRVRYRRDLRDDIEELPQLPIVTHSGETVPLGDLATLETTWGPGAINSENARLIAHVAFATSGVTGDLESVAAIERDLRDAMSKSPEDEDSLTLPPGYSLETVGSFRNQIEANARLAWLVPLVVVINLLIIYLQFRRWPLTFAVFSGIPIAFAGGMIALAIAGTEMNTAVWIGFIALFGIAVDDGVVLATYLAQVFAARKPGSIEEIRDAVVEAGRTRIRPCLMTTATTVLALLPVLISTGRGADVAKAMALPVFGGMSVELLTLLAVPTVFAALEEAKLRLSERHDASTSFP